MSHHRWPARLHAVATAHRRAQGHEPGNADVHGALDVIRLARLLHPELHLEDALHQLAVDQTHQGRPPTPAPATVGGELHSLDRYRQTQFRCA